MPKYRKLWLKTTESLDINEMPDDFTRLLWVLLPLGLDCEGRGQDNIAWIKAKVMPLREDVTHKQVADAMAWYAARGMIIRYTVAGRRYFHVPTFKHYQGNTLKEAASDYPEPPVVTNSGPTPDLLRTNSTTDADADADTDAYTDTACTTRKRAAPPPIQIVAFQEAAGGKLLPRKATWATIVKAIPDTEPALQKWRDVVAAWMCTPYSPQNINGMLDWYRDGIPERMKGHSNGRQSTDGPSQPPEWCSRTNAGLADGSLRVVETFGQ
jgi:hypothetical protein